MYTLKLKEKDVQIELIDAPGMAKASFPISENVTRCYKATNITLLTGLVEYAISDLVDGMEYPVKTDRVIVKELAQIMSLVDVMSPGQSPDEWLSKMVIDAVISRSNDFEGVHAFLLSGEFRQPLLIKSVDVSETGTVTTTMNDTHEGASYVLLDSEGLEFRSNATGKFNTVPEGTYTLKVTLGTQETTQEVVINLTQ